MNAWTTVLHAAHIMPATMTMKTGLGPSYEMMKGMASPPSALTEIMTDNYWYLLAAARDEKKANDFKKLGAHHHRMILNPSMFDVNLPVTEPIPSLVAFLDRKTSGQARNHLKYELITGSY
jgi:hypothetical protein